MSVRKPLYEKSSFIKADRPFNWDYCERDYAPMFRKRFHVNRFERATVSVCALGMGVFYLNGEKITADLHLSPTSDYDKTIWYNEYDVTNLLVPGENTFACIVGNGWYNESLKTPWKYCEAKWRDNPKFALSLELDGETVFLSDDTWLCKPESYILFNQLRSGEHVDARQYDPKWMKAEYDDSAWERAIRDDNPPKGVLRKSVCPPVRECAEYPAVSVLQTGDRRYVFDIGQNISGYVRLHVRQKAGDILTIRYAEQIHPDGSLNLNGMDSMYPESPFQTDKVILSDETVAFSPIFTYHGFRYIEITGLDSASVDMVTGIFIHLDIPVIGEFECSNSDLTDLFHIGVMATYSNMHYILTDCPTREKFGWLNDAKASTEQILMNFDAARFFEKWHVDILDSVREDGAIPGIAPTSGCLYDSYTGPICTGALFEIPYKIYLYTGDDAMMIGALPAYLKHLDYLETRKNADGFVEYGLYDWAGPFNERYGSGAPTPVEFSDTALYIEFLQRTVFAAERAGDSDTAARVQSTLDRMVSLFKQKYLRGDGRCAVDEQTAIAMLIGIGLYDDLAPLREQLKEAAQQHDFHHHCGMLGIRYLYDALNTCGLEAYAYRVIAAEGFPSYTQWLREGATTLWETFYPGASKNHHMYSGFMLWLMNTLVGINPISGAPGMRHVRVAPFFAPELTYVKGARIIGDGTLRVQWRRKEDEVTVDIDVPKGISVEYRGEVLAEGRYSFGE